MNIASIDPAHDAHHHTYHPELLYAGFNQDSGCFACGITNGFIIYNVDPFRETFRRIFPNGGIGIVEMLFRCNLLAIVGGGRNPRYPTNKVMIWDDHQNKCIGELKFRTEVKAVKLRRDRIVVVLESKVFVYRFKDLRLLDQITTVNNPKGLVSLCSEAKSNVLAVPGLARGTIRVELYDIAKATLLRAHDADLAQFALNPDGSRIASASEKGTLIRIWNCYTGEAMRELRRGMDRAEIYCLTFNQTSTFLACSSDKGTVHIFSLSGTPVRATTLGEGNNNTNGSISERMVSQSVDTGPNNTVFRQSESLVNAAAFGGSASVSTNTASMAVRDLQREQQGGSTRGTTGPTTGMGSESDHNNKNMTGMGNFLKGFLPSGFVPKYFESEWSFAQVRGIESRSICAFSKDSSKIIVISADGNFIVSSVEEGECPRVSTTKYLKSSEEGHPEDELWSNAGGGGSAAGSGLGAVSTSGKA